MFPPPVRVPYREAKIRLKPHPRGYQWRGFALRGERKEALEKILLQFIDRGWLQPCHSEWASPCFFVPKNVTGDRRLMLNYRGINTQTHPESYTLPLIGDMLQRRIFTVIDLRHGYCLSPMSPLRAAP